MTKYGGREHQEHYLLLSHEEKLRQQLLGNATVDLVDAILYRAIELNASDIHLQPEPLLLRVRYRIDGVLHDQETINSEQISQFLSRIKVLSGLDIAERRIPQDGSFTVMLYSKGLPTVREKITNEPIDLRVATFPATYGEKIVIRILDRSKNMLDLVALGIDGDIFSSIKRLITMPHGLFLVTGPTGSGKTTSLYAMLGQMNTREKNILTMEDPVEFDLPGITQSQVNNRLGFTFENGLRSMLRQDPDVIMVGEIRDIPTVQMAIEAALTGHLVLSTLHTNNAAGAITRLLDMGIEPFLLNASLVGILAQRLVRKLCTSCKRQEELSDEEKKYLMTRQISLSHVWRAPGCNQCMLFGYQGRVGIFELIMVDDDLRRLIIQKPSIDAIEEQAKQKGFGSLFEKGMELVKRGVVSLEELLLVTG